MSAAVPAMIPIARNGNTQLHGIQFETSILQELRIDDDCHARIVASFVNTSKPLAHLIYPD